MRVILRQDVSKLGAVGDTVEVADGYARNHLFPQKLALESTPANERRVAKERTRRAEQETARTAAAREVAERLAGVSVTIAARADGETLYGSVGGPEIAAALAEERGLELDPAAIRLEQPIKTVGTHDVPVVLGEGIEARLKVWVVPEDGGEEKPAEGQS